MSKPHQSLGYNKSFQFILLAGIFGLVVIGISQTIPPKPSSLSAPESDFSSVRAMLHVRQIGAKPHPTNSRESEKVREYLISQIKTLGLDPEIQSALIVNPKNKQTVQVQNVLVKIPGAKSGKALMLVAHYDSVPSGPGAADNGASVAAILETLRAIKAQPPLQNDLICLFTDSEEVGLLGAQAFVDQHPWEKQVGLALNFEYRGNSGAFMMFETSENNGLLIEGLATAVPFVMATSLMYEVYKHLSNDTDFTVFKLAGIPGMNFAAIEGHAAYHTQLDRPEYLNQGTLQHEGGIMMALVRHFGNQRLDDLKAENRMYFDFPGLGIIHYPMRWALPLFGALSILAITICISNYKAKSIRKIPTLIAMCSYLMLVFGLYIANSSIWTAIGVFHPEYETFAYYDNFKSYCYLLGFVVFNSAVVWVFYQRAKRWFKTMELNLGVAAIWFLLALFTLDNGLNFLFYWPLLAFLLTLVLVRLPSIKNKVELNALILLAGSAPGLLLFTPLIKNLFVGLTPSYMSIILIFLSLLLGLLFPLLAAINSNRRYRIRRR